MTAREIIKVTGRADINTAPDLRSRIRAAFDKQPLEINVDLSEVSYMDSAGVAVLIEAMQWGRKEKVIFSLLNLSPAAQSVLEIARVDKLISSTRIAPPKA